MRAKKLCCSDAFADSTPPFPIRNRLLGVIVTDVAEVNVAYFLGEVAATAIVPVIGAVLLFIGLRQQSRARRASTDHPPPGPSPSGPPPNAGLSYQPIPPTPPIPYPAPRPSQWSIVLIVLGSLLLIFGLLGIIGRVSDIDVHASTTPPSLSVGQCIGADNFRNHTKNPKAQDCSAPDSIFEVVTKGGPCPDGKTDDSDYAFLRDGSTTVCFILNFVQGRCYTAAGGGPNPLFAAADCDSTAPRFKVVNRVDGSSDTASCPDGTREIAYQNPARLYCLQPLKN